MKSLALLLGCMALAAVCAAAPKGYEAPISEVGTATAVTLSTFTLTMIPSASSVNGRSGFMVGVKDTTSTFVTGVLGDCTSTSEAVTDASIVISEKSFIFIPATNSACLYLISGPEAKTAAVADVVTVQEVKQK